MISLVITIIVLIILVNITLSLTLGDNGIINRTEDAIIMWNKANNDETTALGELKNLILGGSEVQEKIGLKDIYNDKMIGTKIEYESNDISDWIIFGRENEYILITTLSPVDKVLYNVDGGVKSYLEYINQLNEECSKYGKTIQGKEVISKSISLQNINYVLGFDEPEFEEFTFTGWLPDYQKREVNFYYPSSEASNYWQNPRIKPGKFKNDYYTIEYNNGNIIYQGADTNNRQINGKDKIKNIDNIKYIIGSNTTNFFNYFVSNTSANINVLNAKFNIAGVVDGKISSEMKTLCSSNVLGGHSDYVGQESYVRPVVYLPDNLIVKQNKDGLITIE